MRFSLLVLGKPKFSFWQEAQVHYAKSICQLSTIDIIELRDQGGEPAKELLVLKNAWDKRRANGGARLVALDEAGKKFSSLDFAAELTRWADQGIREAVFIVGGPYGLAPELKQEAQLLLSLSPLTMPHDLARVVFLEQLYRALHIQAGSKYHHA